MGNYTSIDQDTKDTTISCDVNFIATKLYGKQYDDLNQMQRKKVDSYQKTMKANQNLYSGVFPLTEQQRKRLYRLADLTYKMNHSRQSGIFDRLFELEYDIEALEEELSDVQERPAYLLMKERQPKMRQRAEKIEALEEELDTLENKEKNTKKQLSIKNKKLYKEYQQNNDLIF